MTTPAAANRHCPLCGGKAIELCLPHPDQSMLSDGRIVPRVLAKTSCHSCGAAFHSCAATRVEVTYDEEYQLPTSSPKSDAARARAYCGWIRSFCDAPRAILEIGCGSGALLSELLKTWPEVSGFGIDPALPDGARSEGRLRLARGFVEGISHDAGPFDLIVAVNVIEHTPDPAAFLDALRMRLALNGRIVIICPAAQQPNVELLFFDHLYSLTPEALWIAAKKATLVLDRQAPAPQEIGDFQMTMLAAAGPDIRPRHARPACDLYTERQSYLEGWSKLDRTLLDRSNSCSQLLAFGGGQTAALLRAYAPRTWARIERIVLDDVSEAWKLGRPVASYRDAVQNPGGAVLIATSPHVQNAIAERLTRDGLRSITWNDLIPH
ncbi:Methyltransferase domain-containing protein [Bradyrhizobium lablabi]|nr:Methyltransferase domain-containing protein [Bradyrhizobium lablabi]